MWRVFPDLLLIDTTYNTNMYKWPFVQFVGVTSTSKSFCIAHAVIFREQECNFTWALERLKHMLVDCREPRVILTDKDQALMNACETIFPNATKNLCRWHIMQNIQRKHKSLCRMISLNHSITVGNYCMPRQQNLCTTTIAVKWKQQAWYYIRDNWLVPYKEKFVSCWIDDRLNFGEHTTNRVEGQHANLKRYLPGPNNSLDSIAAFALEVVNSQMEEISATLEDSRVRIKKYYKLTLFDKLHNMVSLFAIAKLDKELTMLDTLQDTGVECDHRLQTSWGLPCACKLNWYTINNIRIPLKYIDPFWRKLDFSPASVGHEEPDYEAELEDVKKQVLGLNNRMQKKSLFSKIMSVLPGKSNKEEPEKREDPRGRPNLNQQAKKRDTPRQSSYSPSPSTDTHRHRLNYEINGNYDTVRDSLDYSTSALFQQKSGWFKLPGHGHVVAQTYDCVLINLHLTSSESYFPMRKSPEPLSQIPVIGVLNVADNHWLNIQLEGNFPVPLLARQWEGYANEAVHEWRSLYEDRIKEYMRIKETWRVQTEEAVYLG
ncbi:protein FAR1-RELATED SEQUENCE 6-like [Bidens hawaiensis]|uniref:protein FAR1-RELATED SEQUENCE 6-like n=1 Tax=Bidens hawaiensis TaxID=980011 RepID=UPI00404A1012